MKITSTLLLTGMMATFCCSIVSAQIIYSNDFTSGEAVTLNGVAPTVANNYAGGTNTAHWFFVTTNNDDELLANGVINASTRNSVLLPFTPQPGSYYFMTASVNEVPVGGAWQGIGFAQSGPTNLNDTGASRFTDNPPNGYAWMSYRVGDQCQLWTGAGAHNPASGQLNMMPSPGLYTVEVMLNTMDASHWTVSAFINGVQVGTNYTYAANPPIAFAGITMQSGITPGSQWYNYWALSTALVPIITQQPTSQSVGTGNAYTNTVTAIANTSGGPLYYQWFTNDVSITGATTNSELIINPVSASDACTNIYVVITNNYGAVTSAVTSLTVEAAPVFSAIIPTTYTNPMTLFGGTNVEGTNYVGSSPTFSVSVIGGQPITYQWLTNGVTVVGATGDSLALTNCQLNSPTNFTCIVTNNYGKLTNVWSVSYLPTPMASYPQAVLADQPVGFWRLN